MKKHIICLIVLAISLIACKEKKETTTELSNEAKIELEKVENSLDEVSDEVKIKSKELDDALSELDNI